VTEDLTAALARKLVGQPKALETVVPYVRMFQAGLAPEGRPVGVFLLLGPTGTGKTRTVEALAEVLHASEKNVLRIDCGEFQLEHEVAKLIGAPPGYLGHRETQAMLNQQRLNAAASERCGLSLVLFDEIEKAAPSMARLLLGVLDKGVLRLGDNTTVNFENSLVFLTSNLGAREMMRQIQPQFGFQSAVAGARTDLAGKLESVGMAAVRKRFSPEFVNRIDAIVTYQPLGEGSLEAILDQRVGRLQDHIRTRLGSRAFTLDVTPGARAFLLRKGTSAEYGARELNRTVHRSLAQPLAEMVVAGRVPAGATVRVEGEESAKTLRLRPIEATTREGGPPAVLVVDDNPDVVSLLGRLLAAEGWRLVVAGSAGEARKLAAGERPDVALLDYLLPDGNGVALGVEIARVAPGTCVLVMTGTLLEPEEEDLCEELDFPILRKPFLAAELVDHIRARLALAGTHKKAAPLAGARLAKTGLTAD
jgi:CheY-like chemotaxis protein